MATYETHNQPKSFETTQNQSQAVETSQNHPKSPNINLNTQAKTSQMHSKILETSNLDFLQLIF